MYCLIGLGDDGMSNNRMFSLFEVEIKLSDYGMVRVTHGCAADADQHTDCVPSHSSYKYHLSITS